MDTIFMKIVKHLILTDYYLVFHEKKLKEKA